MKRRSLRLEYWAGVAIMATLLAAISAHAEDTAAKALPTQTTLSVIHGANGSSQATVNVIGADGLPAQGVVSVEEGDKVLSEAKLDARGQATAAVTLPAGNHTLQASYAGDANHQTSVSDTAAVRTDATASTTPGFQVSVTPVAPTTLPVTLTAGQSGSVTVTLTPVNSSALTAPMFVTLSCSGLPSMASCSFTPANLEILPSTPASCTAGSPASACPPTSLMVISTVGQATKGPATAHSVPPAGPGHHGNPVAWALLLPGVLGLGGIAWGTRRRRWLQRLSLIALIGVVTTLGTTGCNPLWYYYNHGPTLSPPTPAGTYTVTVNGQSSNGVSSTSNSTTLVLTVK